MQQPKSFKGYERTWYPPITCSNNENYTTISSSEDNNKSFSLLSYNILAQALCNRQGSQKYLTKSQAKWNVRRSNLLNEISHYNSDLISLQECDFYDSYWKTELEKIGYETMYSQQFNCEKNYQPMPYGLLTGYKKDKFKLLDFTILDYQKEILKDVNITDIEVFEAKLSGNIALICVLSPIDQPENILILSNTHLYWRPECNSVRVRQALILMQTVEKLQQFYKIQGYQSVEFVLTGDFNTSPNDVPYILLTTRNHSERFRGDHNAVKFWDVYFGGTEEDFMREFPIVFIEEIKLNLEEKLQKETTQLQHTNNDSSFEEPVNATDSIRQPTVEVAEIFKEQFQQRIRNIKQCIEEFTLSSPMVSLYTFYNSHCDKDDDIKALRVHERWQNNDLPYTTYTPHFVSTLDYVFVSANSTLTLTHLLSIPTPQQIQEEHAQLTNENDPPPGEQQQIVWIPNNIHASDHFSLGVRMSQLV